MCGMRSPKDAGLRFRNAMRAKPEMRPPVPIIATAIRLSRVRSGGVGGAEDCLGCPDDMWSGAAAAELSATAGVMDGPAHGWTGCAPGLARVRDVEPESVPVSRIPSRERKDGVVVSVNVGTSKRVGLR